MTKPDWLDEKFLETVLQNKEKNIKATVINYSVNPATSAGDNYCSYLYRVAVAYKTDEAINQQSNQLINTSLIIKTPPKSGMFQELTVESGLWDVEPLLYNVILPKIINRVNCTFAPKSLVSPLKNVLVLQDLKPEGYIVLDRLQQMDFVHCKKVIEILAAFHAGSIACSHENPELVKPLQKENFFQKKGPFERRMKVWMQASFRQCANTLEGIGGHGPTVELLRKKADTIWDSILDMCTPKSNTVNAITHGDCWTNNLLFKYSSDGTLLDLQVVDFQMARFGSPVQDLIIFIWSSANEHVREKRQHELHEIYVKSFNKTLEKLDCSERLTLQRLQEDIKTNRDWILMTLCFLVPFYVCPSEDAIDLGSLTLEQLKAIETDPRFLKMFNNKHFNRVVVGISRDLNISNLF